MFWKKWLRREELEQPNLDLSLDPDRIPAHIAIIMDGNGRWAKKQGLPRIAGHKEGMSTVKRIAIEADQLGVKALTLYAFSTENWARPKEEVNFLMKLPGDFFASFMPELMERNMQVKTIGFMDQLPEATRQVVQRAIDQTAGNTGMVLTFALNYGSRAEIVQVSKDLARSVQEGLLTLEQIDEEVFASALQTNYLGTIANPDLLIRTSGEVRLSNFLLWQLAYAEYVFLEGQWPDFSQADLRQAIAIYQSRQRRFGGLNG